MSLYNSYDSEPTWGDTFRRFWPDTRDVRGARRAVALGCYAYNAMMLLQLVFGWSREGAMPWLVVDLAILAVISFGVYKESAIAALVGVAYSFLAHVLTLFNESTGCVFLIVSLLVTVGTWNGVRGVFALRRLAAAAAQDGVAQ